MVPQEGAPGLTRPPGRLAPGSGGWSGCSPRGPACAAPHGSARCPTAGCPGTGARSAPAPRDSAGAAPGGAVTASARTGATPAGASARPSRAGRAPGDAASRAARRAGTQSNVSRVRSRGRRRVGRVSTASWWRSSRCSVSRSLRSRRAARSTASRRARLDAAPACLPALLAVCLSGLLPSYNGTKPIAHHRRRNVVAPAAEGNPSRRRRVRNLASAGWLPQPRGRVGCFVVGPFAGRLPDATGSAGRRPPVGHAPVRRARMAPARTAGT